MSGVVCDRRATRTWPKRAFGSRCARDRKRHALRFAAMRDERCGRRVARVCRGAGCSPTDAKRGGKLRGVSYVQEGLANAHRPPRYTSRCEARQRPKQSTPAAQSRRTGILVSAATGAHMNGEDAGAIVVQIWSRAHVLKEKL